MLRLGLAGLGKIARDEHLPAIARTPGARLIAVSSRNARADGVRNYGCLEAMLAAEPQMDAVILCQPPQARYAAARAALLAGKHVFLEKPPGATLTEVAALVDVAEDRGVTLFAGWHSRWSPAVRKLQRWCARNPLDQVMITWCEDVRRWHPGQPWIWDAGGFGVFDPGINALSVLTQVIGERVRVVDAELEVPSNCAAPIAARLTMETASGVPVLAVFDWRQTGPQTWTIVAESGGDRFIFGQGEGESDLPGDAPQSPLAVEYRAMYRRFVDLVRARKSEVDVAPLQLVADSFMKGRILMVDPFED